MPSAGLVKRCRTKKINNLQPNRSYASDFAPFLQAVLTGSKIWLTDLIPGRKIAPALDFRFVVTFCGLGAAPAIFRTINPYNSALGRAIVDGHGQRSSCSQVDRNLKRFAVDRDAS